MEQPTGIKLCECGCGQPAPIAKRNENGYLKGEPKRFILGHSSRNDRAGAFKGDKAGYGAIHSYLRKHFPKSGVCDECGKPAARTEYALIKGREYSRNREDYRELCKLCHNRYDETGGSRWRGVTTARQAAGEAPSCACGCGNAVSWDYKHARWFRYLLGHRRGAESQAGSRPPRAGQHRELLPTMACDFCGSEFQPRQLDAKFCSRKCVAAGRRASGVDDVERVCHQCGDSFTRNRYEKVRHCSKSCSAKCQHAGGCPG